MTRALKTVDVDEAKEPLSRYAKRAEKSPMVLTRKGKPVAALVHVGGMDMESISISTNPKFIEIIERSRKSPAERGGVSLSEMRRRLGA